MRFCVACICLPLAVLAQTSESAEAHLGRGYEALKQDRFEAAVSEFQAALRLDPTLVMRAGFPMAVAYFEMKQSDNARREFEAVRREAGDQPNVAYYLGRLDLQDQSFAGAVRNLSKAITKPPFPDTAYYFGLAYFKEDDLPAAEKWLKQAADINPRDSQALYQLALVYRKEGHESDAKRAFARSAELRRQDTSDSELRRECAQKLDSGTRAEARELCRRLYDPDSAERLTALGTIYGQHGDLEDALEPLKRAAELAPQSPQMQYNLAFTYYRMGRLDEARAPIAKAVERWPDIFQLNLLYGAVLAKLGEDQPAYEALHRARELNPEDRSATDLLYDTALKLGRKSQGAHRYADALRYYGEAAKLRPSAPEPHQGLAEVKRLLSKE